MTLSDAHVCLNPWNVIGGGEKRGRKLEMDMESEKNRLPAVAMQKGSVALSSVARSALRCRRDRETLKMATIRPEVTGRGPKTIVLQHTEDHPPERDHHERDEQERALTIREFCILENMSPATYYKMKRLGYGAEEVRIPGTAFVRITPAARRAWHDKLDRLRQSQAAELEAARRTALSAHAGKIAAASPLHHCRRKTEGRRKAGKAAARVEA